MKLEELGGGRVDIIVSEWMGYCLFFEAMFDSVIYARDNFLKKKGGIMIPDIAEFFIAASLQDYHPLYDNVLGFDLSHISVYNNPKTPVVGYVEKKHLSSNTLSLRVFDLTKITVEEV